MTQGGEKPEASILDDQTNEFQCAVAAAPNPYAAGYHSFDALIADFDKPRTAREPQDYAKKRGGKGSRLLRFPKEPKRHLSKTRCGNHGLPSRPRMDDSRSALAFGKSLLDDSDSANSSAPRNKSGLCRAPIPTATNTSHHRQHVAQEPQCSGRRSAWKSHRSHRRRLESQLRRR